MFTRLAQALADEGVITVRYDRRGSGQSGGRLDSVTLGDYADDAAAAVKWLAPARRRRPPAASSSWDPATAARSALIAAGRNKDIDGVITVDAAGTTGAELSAAPAAAVLDGLKLPDAERQARIALQKKIQSAVISGSGLGRACRRRCARQAETLLVPQPAPLRSSNCGAPECGSRC